MVASNVAVFPPSVSKSRKKGNIRTMFVTLILTQVVLFFLEMATKMRRALRRTPP